MRRNQSGDRLALFRIVKLRTDGGLSDRVEVGVDDNDPENWILVVGAIQLKARAAEVLSVYENLQASLRILGCGVAPPGQLLRARGQQLKRGKVTLVHREVLNEAIVKGGADIGAVGLQLRRLARNLQGFRRRSQLELSVNALRGIGHHRNSCLLERLEALRLNFDRIGVANNQVCDGVISRIIGRCGVGRALGCIGHRHRRICNRRALRICNCSVDTASRHLPVYRSRSQHQNRAHDYGQYPPFCHFNLRDGIPAARPDSHAAHEPVLSCCKPLLLLLKWRRCELYVFRLNATQRHMSHNEMSRTISLETVQSTFV